MTSAPRTPLAPALSLQRVRIRHEERSVWTPASVSLDIAPGEVVLLLGPSGSGKSTLALAVNGLIPHDVPARLEGSIHTGGLDTVDATVAELSRHVGMVFQDPDAQIVTGTVLDEVCFGPENLLVPAGEIMRRAKRALEQVGLWHRRHDNPDRLSGGGRQRLAIACALALESPLLVLDEPTANLDPAGIAEVYSVLRSIVCQEDGPRPAILLVEHNLDAAVELLDRVAVLDREGHLVLEGPARQALRDNAEALHELGVWLPVATLAALRLRAAGIALDPLPLTPAELAIALDAAPSLPPLPATSRTPTAPELSPLVRVRGLGVARDGESVVRGVDLDVRRGEFLAIVGTNGAGKTTLIQAIAGVLRADSGTVRIGDVDPANVDAATRSRSIGFVFQNPEHQFVAATVFDELAHGLRHRRRGEPRLTETEITEQVERMLRRFGLAELRDEHPFLLSGGQKRRLSVGTALIVGPPVIVLDEPTFGQDRERASALLELLAGLRDAGTTVIVVTHDLQLVADHASHIAVMGAGEVLELGTAEDILGNPRLLQRAGLRMPPLASAMRRLERHEKWRHVIRVNELPGAAATSYRSRMAGFHGPGAPGSTASGAGS